MSTQGSNTDSPSPLPSLSKQSSIKRTLKFVKEWGGIATLIIALVYTFPLGIMDRIINRQERAIDAENRAIAEARQATSDMASLRAEKISRQVNSTDARYQDALNSAYDIRIYNIIYSKKDLFKKWASKLRSSETYSIGSSLTLIGEIEDSLFYYDLAIEQSRAESKPATEITILRERGYSLFLESPAQNLNGAREDYIKALGILSSTKAGWSRSRYIILLSELSSFELSLGDWACGDDLRLRVISLFQNVIPLDQGLIPYYTMFQQNIAIYKKKAGQPNVGCSYKIPISV